LKSILVSRESAAAIGVSESSVERCVDHVDPEGMRTAGGHRRVSVEEAAGYPRECSLPLVRPDLLRRVDR
jgi:hypothetical protein